MSYRVFLKRFLKLPLSKIDKIVLIFYKNYHILFLKKNSVFKIVKIVPQILIVINVNQVYFW
jgi:hypothetical protein